MLIEFSVANFRSIKGRVTLSMLAAEEDWLAENAVQPQGYEGRLLKSAVIYGANASGKSNVLKAMEFMVKFIQDSHKIQRGDKIPVSRFRLDNALANQPGEFEMIFLHNEMKYAYGFMVDHRKVHEEYLYSYPENQQTLIFERTDTNEYEFGEDEREQEVLSKRTNENMLYLAVATQFNFAPVAKVFEWFLKFELWIEPELASFSEETAQKFYEDEGFADLVRKFLVSADLGIQDLEVQKLESPILSFDFEEEIGIHYDLKIFRHSVDEHGNAQKVAFRLKDESRGTQRMFELLGPWFEVLSQGSLLIVDELENSLHPLMTEQFIKLFHDPTLNPNGAQLIFTTHNTNLLDTTIFRRDQIWFTEKDPSKGSTDLYALHEFEPRQDEDVERGYLIGRYGAIPYFSGGTWHDSKD